MHFTLLHFLTFFIFCLGALMDKDTSLPSLCSTVDISGFDPRRSRPNSSPNCLSPAPDPEGIRAHQHSPSIEFLTTFLPAPSQRFPHLPSIPRLSDNRVLCLPHIGAILDTTTTHTSTAMSASSAPDSSNISTCSGVRIPSAKQAPLCATLSRRQLGSSRREALGFTAARPSFVYNIPV